MTQKTAMQQAIDKIATEINRKSLAGLKDENTSYYISGLQNAKSFLSLATEKQHIIDTYKYALPANMSEAQKQDEAEFYYNQTYGQQNHSPEKKEYERKEQDK